MSNSKFVSYKISLSSLNTISLKWLAIPAILGAIFVASIGSLSATEVQTDDKNSKVIVVQEGPGHIVNSPKVFVESGTDQVTGDPTDNVKGAYRAWKQRCTEWQAELKQLNGKNLIFSSCGQVKRTEESHQSEKLYTYSSNGTYKIRVSSAEK